MARLRSRILQKGAAKGQMIFKKGTRFLSAHVTHLEMHAPNPVDVPVPDDGNPYLVLARACPVHFYRYLYAQIGKAHHWTQRLKKTDEELEDILHSPQTLLYIFYVDGCPAGFAEINLRVWPAVEILYFGLIPDFQGRGLARFFFTQALAIAWAQKPEKVIIQTNTLDSPRALSLYQKMGFKEASTREIVLEAWPHSM